FFQDVTVAVEPQELLDPPDTPLRILLVILAEAPVFVGSVVEPEGAGGKVLLVRLVAVPECIGVVVILIARADQLVTRDLDRPDIEGISPRFFSFRLEVATLGELLDHLPQQQRSPALPSQAPLVLRRPDRPRIRPRRGLVGQVPVDRDIPRHHGVELLCQMFIRCQSTHLLFSGKRFLPELLETTSGRPFPSTLANLPTPWSQAMARFLAGRASRQVGTVFRAGALFSIFPRRLRRITMIPISCTS